VSGDKFVHGEVMNFEAESGPAPGVKRRRKNWTTLKKPPREGTRLQSMPISEEFL
jgi:hypothetical protein